MTDPSSGKMVITWNNFNDWTMVTYYFNSGQGYSDYIFRFEVKTTGNSYDIYMDDISILPTTLTSIDSYAATEDSGMKLFQNFPNPASTATQITFKTEESGTVSLEVFDQTGKKLTTFLNDYQEQGLHHVDFKRFYKRHCFFFQ